MNQDQLGTQHQALVDKLLTQDKSIRNIVLGVSSGQASFAWSGAAGLAEPAAGRPMQPQTPFLIASVTKMYTAAAIMKLRDRGQIQLDQAISEFFPAGALDGLHHHQGQDYTRALTIRHLISQTSGLPDYFMERPKGGSSVLEQLAAGGDRGWELDDVVKLTRESFPAKFPPAGSESGADRSRAKAHYSDTNYKLLGAILESVMGQPLPGVFEQLFFAPLGLRQTYLYGQPSPGADGQPAQVFYKNQLLVADRLMRTHGPEGGLVSTVDDTLRFGQAMMRGELFASPDTLTEMQTWRPIFFPFQYGYGLMRFKLPRLMAPFGYTPELIGHSGSSGSFLYHDRQLDLYLAGTINQVARQNAPFRLMIMAAQLFHKAAR